jgi:hypothetical protein
MTATASLSAVRVDGAEIASIELPERAPFGPPLGEPLDGPMETGWRGLWRSADGVMSAGIWECEPGRFHTVFEGAGEFIHVISGRLIVTEEGGKPIELGPGDAMTFPTGWTGEWRITERLRKSFAGWRNADAGKSDGSRLIEGATVTQVALEECPAIQTKAGPMGTRDKTTWQTADGSIQTGIWECDAGVFHPRFAGYGECIKIVAGEVKCSGEDGSSFTMRPGDVLVFPRTWRGTWNVISPLRKLYTTWTAQ